MILTSQKTVAVREDRESNSARDVLTELFTEQVIPAALKAINNIELLRAAGDKTMGEPRRFYEILIFRLIHLQMHSAR